MTSSSVVLLLAALTVADTLHPYEAVEPHMGTLFRIKLYATDEAQARRAFQAAFARVAALDHTLSDYQPGSELNRLSEIAVQHPVHVSEDLYRILETSQALSRETGGAFDITIGPLTHLWRDARRLNRLPDPASIAQAKAKCGYRHLHLDRALHTAEFDQPGMQLDAGAIAKGYAADQALETITSCGIASALVAASGDLAFSDAPPGESGWKIGIDSIDSANAPFTRVMRLSNGAVSTSGPSEQHLDTGGIRYSHIIDPRTGMGLSRNITVTVVARRGIDADSLATAVSVLGVKHGLALVKHHRGASAIIVAYENGRLSYRESRHF
jgi:thiamine biosynthesis lipoprotein